MSSLQERHRHAMQVWEDAEVARATFDPGDPEELREEFFALYRMITRRVHKLGSLMSRDFAPTPDPDNENCAPAQKKCN